MLEHAGSNRVCKGNIYEFQSAPPFHARQNGHENPDSVQNHARTTFQPKNQSQEKSHTYAFYRRQRRNSGVTSPNMEKWGRQDLNPHMSVTPIILLEPTSLPD